MLIFLVAAPLLISVVIRNIGWVPILGMNGGVNTLLMSLGLIDKPLILINNRIGVVIGMVHALLPFMILTLTTVIQRINPSLEEAARGLGGSNFYVIRRVLLKLSAKGIVAGFLLVFALSISSYTTPAIMGGKRVTVMSTLIEQQVNSVLSYGFGATCSIILMLVALLITIISGRVSGKN
jgi:putative spermidine/putrescine transport system permease protein